MTTPQTTPQFLKDLGIPFRDALRGAASVAGKAEHILSPAAELLPPPLKAGLHDTLSSLEELGKRLVQPSLDQAMIAATGRFLLGDQTESATSTEAANVFVNAWESLKDFGLAQSHLMSETLAADRFARAPNGLAGTDRVAAILIDLQDALAVGPAPGLVAASSPTEKQELSVGLIAIAVWAIAKRADQAVDEPTLLSLSFAMVKAIMLDTDRCTTDAAYLAELLDELSAHL